MLLIADIVASQLIDGNYFILFFNCVIQNMVRGQLTVYPVETKETMHMFQLVKNTNERR